MYTNSKVHQWQFYDFYRNMEVSVLFCQFMIFYWCSVYCNFYFYVVFFVHVNVLMPRSHVCVKPPRMSHVSIAILGIWGDTWLTRGKCGIYVAVRGSYSALKGSMWRLLAILPRKISTLYCRVSYVAVTRIPSLVLRNTWHYVIIRRQQFWFPKFVLRCSYEAALRKGVTTA